MAGDIRPEGAAGVRGRKWEHYFQEQPFFNLGRIHLGNVRWKESCTKAIREWSREWNCQDLMKKGCWLSLLRGCHLLSWICDQRWPYSPLPLFPWPRVPHLLGCNLGWDLSWELYIGTTTKLTCAWCGAHAHLPEVWAQKTHFCGINGHPGACVLVLGSDLGSYTSKSIILLLHSPQASIKDLEPLAFPFPLLPRFSHPRVIPI